MFLFLAVLQYFQIGLVSGGVSKCGDKNIPSYFTRLDYPEIANFIKFPDKGKGNKNMDTCSSFIPTI